MALPAHLLTGWYGCFGTPLLSLVVLQTKFSLVDWSCATGRSGVLAGVAVAGLLLSLTGVAMNYRAWRRMGADVDLAGATPVQWVSWFVVVGLLMSVLSTLVITAMGMAVFLLSPCD